MKILKSAEVTKAEIDKYFGQFPQAQENSIQALESFFVSKDKQIVSSFDLRACETQGNQLVSVRLANYKILNDFKGTETEFAALQAAIDWCQQVGAKIIFWIHRVPAHELQAYQDGFVGAPGHYTQSDAYQSFRLLENYLWQEANSDKYYFVYFKKLDINFNWKPAGDHFLQRYHKGSAQCL